jgi:hypothetical protein
LLLTGIVADHCEVLDPGLKEAANEVLRDPAEAETSHQQFGSIRHFLTRERKITAT